MPVRILQLVSKELGPSFVLNILPWPNDSAPKIFSLQLHSQFSRGPKYIVSLLFRLLGSLLAHKVTAVVCCSLGTLRMGSCGPSIPEHLLLPSLPHPAAGLGKHLCFYADMG